MKFGKRLTNSLMMHGRNNGKKLKTVRIIKHAMKIIHLLTDPNPIQVIVDVVVNSGPREDATRIGSTGVVMRQDVDISSILRVNQAIDLLTIGAREAAFSNSKTVAEFLVDELINAAKGSSNNYAIKKKDEIWKEFLTKTKTKTTLTNLTIIFSCITFAASQHQPYAIILSIVPVFQKGQILLDRYASSCQYLPASTNNQMLLTLSQIQTFLFVMMMKLKREELIATVNNRGSIRYVRLHIMEERDKIFKTFGFEKFNELGFADMGEQVADRWTTEDEHLFHKVVYNNPAPPNKNFWNYLSIVFPSRSKKEIVSYYFDVFMLRKRAEQNSNHLLSADSDNDEYQGNDEHEDDFVEDASPQ